jgi:checkpoint serine/threonine-protein kinase
LKGAELSLVDFGRAIDLTNFTAGTNTKLCGEATGKDMRCVAMRAGKPWSFDIDTFGILCSAYVLLFGIHMEIAKGQDNEWAPRCTFPRYWQREVWTNVFNQLLSAEGSRAENLRKLRERMDEYLSLRKMELLDAMRRQASTLLESS